MDRTAPSRDSSEYAEMVTDVFVETVRKAALDAMCCDYQNEEITPSLMQCLQYVYLRGASSIREIACGLEISVSAGSQLVDRLVRRGLATRNESDSDRRLTRVELSESGSELVKQMRERRSRWFGALVSAMPEAKRHAFLDGLESFLKIALSRDDNIDRACVKCGLEHNTYCVISKLKAERLELNQG